MEGTPKWPTRSANAAGGSYSTPRRGSAVKAHHPNDINRAGVISMRVDQPVEGCELCPHAFFRSNSGNSTKKDVKLTYRWLRSPTSLLCSSELCAHKHTPTEGEESRARYQCTECVKRNLPIDNSLFCSLECLKSSWSSHAVSHNQEGDEPLGGPRKEDAIEKEEFEKARGQCISGSGLRPSHVLVSEKEQRIAEGSKGLHPFFDPIKICDDLWLEVSTSKVYVPTSDDVGHVLRVECTAAYESGSSEGESRLNPDIKRSLFGGDVSVAGTNDIVLEGSMTNGQRGEGRNCVDEGRLLSRKVLETRIVLARSSPPPSRNFAYTREALQKVMAGVNGLDINQLKALGQDSWDKKGSKLTGLSGSQITMSMPSVSGRRKLRRDSIRVLSYNILAEIYATRQVYPYCPLWALQWSYRGSAVVRELVEHDPDIICVQEAQADHFDEFLYPALKEHGYEGLYKQKTRESMGLEGKVDGCALFYRRSRFDLREKYVIEFNEAAIGMVRRRTAQFKAKNPHATAAEIDSHNKFTTHILQRLLKDNVAQVVVLELLDHSGEDETDCSVADLGALGGSQRSFGGSRSKDLDATLVREAVAKGQTREKSPSGAEERSASGTGKLLCIANTHILSNPEFGDVKLWQAHTLVTELEKLTLSRDLPLILCGDFNSEPESAVYEVLSTGQVRPNHPDLAKDPSKMLPPASWMQHKVALTSAYAAMDENGQEPPYTNYTGHWVGVVDYIWFSSDHFEAEAALVMHPPEVLKQFAKTALPNCQFPSDHVPLCSDLRLLG